MFGSMHRVLSDFLRTRSEDRASELTVLTNALHNLMSEERIRTPTQWPLIDACAPHAFTLLKHVAVEQPRTTFVDHAAALALPLCWMLLEQGFYATASDLALEALRACSIESEPGQFSVPVGRRAVGAFIQRLPEVFRRNGQYDAAIDFQRMFLTALQQQREPDDAELLVV